MGRRRQVEASQHQSTASVNQRSTTTNYSNITALLKHHHIFNKIVDSSITNTSTLLPTLPITSPTTSPTMTTTNNTTTTSPLTKVLQSAKSAWKSHHDSVTAAYTTYYGGSPVTTPHVSQNTTPRVSEERSSEESVRAEGEAKPRRESGVRKSFEGLKRKVQEHHQSVNSAYASYYGAH